MSSGGRFGERKTNVGRGRVGGGGGRMALR